MSSKDNDNPESRDARRSRTNNALKEKMEIELHDRKELAKENRRLAETAGKMLHTLIIKGSTKVKKIIISAIIQQVQQPGSVPPEDVPALMQILRSTAEEQLSLVQGGKLIALEPARAQQHARRLGIQPKTCTRLEPPPPPRMLFEKSIIVASNRAH